MNQPPSRRTFSNFLFLISQKPHFWILLLFIVLPILAFPELIFGGKTLYWSDLSWMHYPRHIFAAAEWLAGRAPLWDPYEHLGLPLLAESQVGALYPVSAIFLSPFSPSLELSLYILVHFTLAALFTFILTRSLGLSRPAATLAGLSFGFGGFLMGQTPNLNIMTGGVWLPLILYGVIQVMRRRTWLSALLAGLPLALQIFTAQPQMVFYTLVIVAGYGVYRLIADAVGTDLKPASALARHSLQTTLLLTVMVGSGLLLAAPQLLPTFELQQLSTRANERGLDFLTKNSWPPVMALNLLLPSIFGNNVIGFKGGDPFQEDFIYIGFMPLLLLGWSWGQRQRRDALFFGVLLVGTVLLAVGRYTPLYAYIIQYLPGFSLFRIPSRWLMGVNLALAVLAGLGLETLLQKKVTRPVLIAFLAVNLTLLAILILAWLFQSDLLAWRSTIQNEFYNRLFVAGVRKSFDLDPIYQNRLWPGWLISLSTPGVLLIVNILIAVTLFIFYAARRMPQSVFAVLVIMAVSLDLAAAGGATVNPTQPDSWWLRLSGGAKFILANIGEGRVLSMGTNSEKEGVSHLGQYFPSVHRVRSAVGHGSSLLINRHNAFLHLAHPVQAIQVTGVRYILTLGAMGPDVSATYPLAYSDADSVVYENKNPLPRAFIVHQAIQASNPTEALAYFKGRDIDPGQTVVIESDQPLPRLAASPNPVASAAAIVEENPQAINIKTTSAADGYLVLLDTYYPGWTAAVDGQSTPIYRADYIVRAVFVPAGEHEVNFTYRPWSFYGGVGLSLVIFALAVTTWLSHRQRGQTT